MANHQQVIRSSLSFHGVTLESSAPLVAVQRTVQYNDPSTALALSPSQTYQSAASCLPASNQVATVSAVSVQQSGSYTEMYSFVYGPTPRRGRRRRYRGRWSANGNHQNQVSAPRTQASQARQTAFGQGTGHGNSDPNTEASHQGFAAGFANSSYALQSPTATSQNQPGLGSFTANSTGLFGSRQDQTGSAVSTNASLGPFDRPLNYLGRNSLSVTSLQAAPAAASVLSNTFGTAPSTTSPFAAGISFGRSSNTNPSFNPAPRTWNGFGQSSSTGYGSSNHRAPGFVSTSNNNPGLFTSTTSQHPFNSNFHIPPPYQPSASDPAQHSHTGPNFAVKREADSSEPGIVF